MSNIYLQLQNSQFGFAENPQCRNFIHPMETTSETFQFLQDQCNSDNDLDEDLTEALDVTCGNYKPVSVDQARALYIWLKDELEQILYN